MVVKEKAILPKNNCASTAKESSLRLPEIYGTGGRRESNAVQIFQGLFGHENSQKVNLAKDNNEHLSKRFSKKMFRTGGRGSIRRKT